MNIDRRNCFIIQQLTQLPGYRLTLAGACLMAIHLPAYAISTAPQSNPGNGDRSQSSMSLLMAQRSNRPTLRVGSQGEAVSELQALLKLLGYYGGAVDGSFQQSTATAVSAFQQAAGLTPDGVVGPATWERLLPSVAIAPSPGSPSPSLPSPGLPAPSPAPTPRPSPTPTPRPTASPAPRPSPTPTPRPAASPTPRPTTPSRSPAPSPRPAQPNPADLPVLREGMRGADVTRLQERLRARGFYQGAIDGIFGPETLAAVQAAQRRFNLEPDGIVGPATWRALLR